MVKGRQASVACGIIGLSKSLTWCECTRDSCMSLEDGSSQTTEEEATRKGGSAVAWTKGSVWVGPRTALAGSDKWTTGWEVEGIEVGGSDVARVARIMFSLQL